jgi:hypothetical protein
MNLTNINRVTVYNYKNYNSERSCNGGEYGFTNEYYRIDGNNFECHYFTTADFDFCEKMGKFQECHTCSRIDYCEFELISEEKLIEILKAIEEENNENYGYILE